MMIGKLALKVENGLAKVILTLADGQSVEIQNVISRDEDIEIALNVDSMATVRIPFMVDVLDVDFQL